MRNIICINKKLFLVIFFALSLALLLPTRVEATFPTVSSGTNATSVTDSATHNITMPATVNAGDLLMVVASYDGIVSIADPSAPSGWTKLFSKSADSTNYWLAVFIKDAAGTEDGSSVNFASNVNTSVSAQVYRIANNTWGGNLSDVEVEATGVTSNGASAFDPPVLSASWGAQDNLWIVVAGQGDDTAISSYPTNYSNGIAAVATGTRQSAVASARRNLNASNENPAVITFAASDPGAATTIVVKPNTPPTFSAQPSTVATGLTRTGPLNTPWAFTFTASDAQETGANALTYTLKRNSDSATIGSVTGNFTSGAGQTINGTAYNATNLASGTNVLRVDVSDGTNTTASNTFNVFRDDANPSSAGTISTSPSTVGSDNQYTVTFTPSDALSTSADEIRYWVNPTAGGLTEVTTGGAAIEDGGSNPGGETEAQAFDDSSATKWLIFSATSANLGYDFSGATTKTVTSYSLTSANDSDTRDPKNWNFQGSNNGTDWTTLDTRTGETFASRFLTKNYSFSNVTAYQMYRLNITLNNGAGDTQLAELSMYEGNVLTSGTSTSGAQKTTATVTTDSTLTNGATRYVRLCDGANNCADFSFTITKGSPASVTTLSRTNLTPYSATLNGEANPNSIGATTGYFRYWTSNPGSCTDSGGTRVPSSSGTALGSGNSYVAYAQNITGQNPGVTIYYCAIADNGAAKGFGSLSSFTTPGGGQCSSVPEAGNYTISTSCVFTGTTADGVDNGSGATNNAQMTIQAGQSLTLGPNQTIAYGSISKQGASIVKFSGAILKKGAVWVPDTDDDGYPDTTFAPTTQVIATSKPAGYIRRALANGLGADCNSSDNQVFQNIASSAVDYDLDRYYTGNSATSCVGASQLNNPPSGAILLRDANSSEVSSGTALSITKPSGTTNGDLLVAWLCTDGSSTITNGMGAWTLQAGPYGTGLSCYVYTRTASGEGASYSITWSGSDEHAGIIAAYRSTTGSAVTIDQQASTTYGSGTVYDLPAVTTTTTNTMLVGMFASDDPFFGAGSFSYDSPLAYTDIAINSGLAAGMGSGQKSTAGSTGSSLGATFSYSGDGSGYILALKTTGLTYYRAATGNGVAYYKNRTVTPRSGNNQPMTKPSGVANGDILIAIPCYDDTDTNATINSVPSNWTLIGSRQNTGLVCYAYYKQITNAGGEPSSYTWTWSETPTSGEGILLLFGNEYSSGSVLFDTGLGTGFSTSSTHTLNQITTSYPEELLIGIFVNDDAAGNYSSFSSPLTELYDASTSLYRIAIATGTQAAAGATGNKSASTGSGSDPGSGFLIGIYPTAASSYSYKFAPVSSLLGGSDCRDYTVSINPGVIENESVLCEDGIDNDCNGSDSVCYSYEYQYESEYTYQYQVEYAYQSEYGYQSQYPEYAYEYQSQYPSEY